MKYLKCFLLDKSTKRGHLHQNVATRCVLSAKIRQNVFAARAPAHNRGSLLHSKDPIRGSEKKEGKGEKGARKEREERGRERSNHTGKNSGYVLASTFTPAMLRKYVNLAPTTFNL